MSEIFHSDDPEHGGGGVEHDADTAKIRELNDHFRQTLQGGAILFTAGVNAFPMELKDRIMVAIRTFDRFDDGNDPWRLHDFGAVEVDGQPLHPQKCGAALGRDEAQKITVWFKIDVYDKDHQYGSPDPTDPRVSSRVMTVLLPEEY